MGLDKTPCRGVYRISCSVGSCDEQKDKISPDCINCFRASVEILDLNNKVIGVFPVRQTKKNPKQEGL